MSDSYDAQELLNKLRSKQIVNNSKNSGNHSTPNNITSPNSLSIQSQVQSNKVIKAPVSLTLTPAQRQENLIIRTELEKDIKHLQDEVIELKRTNEVLKSDKLNAEQQLVEQKIKSDDIIVKLRAKVAVLNKQINTLNSNKTNSISTPQSSMIRTGKIYPPPPPPLVLHNHPVKPQLIIKSATKSSYSGCQNEASPIAEGFRDPTFSELMRRSTPEHFEFKESLRHASTVKLNLSNITKSTPPSKPLHLSHQQQLSSLTNNEYSNHNSFHNESYQHMNLSSSSFRKDELLTNHHYNNTHSKLLNNNKSMLQSTKQTNNNNNTSQYYNHEISNDIPIIEVDLQS